MTQALAMPMFMYICVQAQALALAQTKANFLANFLTKAKAKS